LTILFYISIIGVFFNNDNQKSEKIEKSNNYLNYCEVSYNECLYGGTYMENGFDRLMAMLEEFEQTHRKLILLDSERW